MTEEVINEDYTIDLDSMEESAHCPYCGGADFFNGLTVEIIAPDPSIGEKGVFENTCVGCNEKSIWKESAQYKIV